MGNVGYQIFMGSFAKDFKDLEIKIPYLKELGISKLWATPWHPSPSKHGYDITNYYEIRSNYGTIDDFIHASKVLKENGIKLFMDLVICHTSNQHEWFKKSEECVYPYTNYYVWSKTELAAHELANNEDQSNSNLHKWGWSEKRQMFYYCPFDQCMPSLNLDCSELRDEIKSIVYYWSKLGVEGFRTDAILHSHASKHKSIAFWNWFRKVVKKCNPKSEIVGEAWTNAENASDWSNAVGSTFDFDTKYSIEWHTNNGELRGLPNRIKELNDKEKWCGSNHQPFLCNHDMDRIMFSLGNDENKMKLASGILLTTKGNPWIYYGDEVGTTGTKFRTDEDVRKDMEWSLVGDQRNDKNSIFNLYKNLIKVRNNSNALQYGNLAPHWSDSTNCAVYLRSFYDEKVYVVINGKDNSVPHIPHGDYKVLYSTDDYLNGNNIEYFGWGFKQGIHIVQLL